MKYCFIYIRRDEIWFKIFFKIYIYKFSIFFNFKFCVIIWFIIIVKFVKKRGKFVYIDFIFEYVMVCCCIKIKG